MRIEKETVTEIIALNLWMNVFVDEPQFTW